MPNFTIPAVVFPLTFLSQADLVAPSYRAKPATAYLTSALRSSHGSSPPAIRIKTSERERGDHKKSSLGIFEVRFFGAGTTEER